MKLLLVCTAMVLLLSAVELSELQIRRGSSIDEMYRAVNVTPVPDSILDVYFKDNNVPFGMVIAPEQAIDLPIIEYDFEPGCYYTFVCLSPDWPSRCNPFLSNSLLGLNVNIYVKSEYGKLVYDSFEVATWLGPSPPPGTGLHRYLIYIYKQKERLDTTNEKLLSLNYQAILFSLSKFVSTYDLISPPASGTMFYSGYRYDNSEYGYDNSEDLCDNKYD